MLREDIDLTDKAVIISSLRPTIDQRKAIKAGKENANCPKKDGRLIDAIDYISS